jgi:hypothetical protein
MTTQRSMARVAIFVKTEVDMCGIAWDERRKREKFLLKLYEHDETACWGFLYCQT